MSIDIGEINLRILGEFDDTDMYDVYGLMNTVILPPSGSVSDLASFCAGLAKLVAKGVVVLGFEIKPFVPETVLNRDESLDLVARLPDWFKFDREKKIWTRSSGAFRVDPTPFVMLTELGKDEALDIRRRYPFRWWNRAGSAGAP